MRKIPLIALLGILSCSLLYAQDIDKKIDQLMFLDVEEKYDKLVTKGISLSQSESHKKHPLPYLYVAKGYYEMSRSPGKFSVGEKDSKFPKPLKQAQKYLYKFVKKDKKKEYIDDYKDLFLAVADTSNKVGQHLYIMEKQRKAGSVYKAAYKAVPSDPILLLWQGVCEAESKNIVEGEKNMLAAFKKFEGNFEPSKVTSHVLASGILKAEEYFAKKGDVANAKKASTLANTYKKYDPDELDKDKMRERELAEKDRAQKDMIMRKFYSDENEGTGASTESAEEELDRIEREASGE